MMEDDKKSPTGEYEVGYCKPPKATQFQKGGPSANAYGRKGAPDNRAAIAARKEAKKTIDGCINEALNRRRHYKKSNGEVGTATTRSLLAERLVQDVLSTPGAVLKALPELRRAERKAAPHEEAVATGVMVIQQPAATIEEALARARSRGVKR